MNNEQALTIIKQPDRVGCHLIKANDEESCKFNQESIEALNMAVLGLEKLAQIEQIVNEWYDLSFVKTAELIKEVLEKE